ncbi:MAG TPA: alpha/beta hydrolase [Thermoleophilaceae bacterium]
MAERIVYLHGVPESGDMWRPFVERTGGDAPDMPGFGRSDKPASGDYSFRALGRWFSDYTKGLDSFSLVLHDWGAVGLLTAMERPEALERLVIIDAVPFLPGYRWHPVARIWRRRGAGELFMGLSSKWAMRLLAERQNATQIPESVLKEGIDGIWKYFDHGTQRAILRLYRSANEDKLAEAGRELGKITAPALIVWGAKDPYLDPKWAHGYADALGGPAEVEIVEDAAHWPWYEQPRVIDRVAAFLAG